MMRVIKHMYTYRSLRHYKSRTVIRGNPLVMHTKFLALFIDFLPCFIEGGPSSLCSQYTEECKCTQSKHSFIVRIKSSTCFG